MSIELLLMANSIFLFIVFIILLAVSLSEEQPKKKRFKVKDDINKIKEQIAN